MVSRCIAFVAEKAEGTIDGLYFILTNCGLQREANKKGHGTHNYPLINYSFRLRIRIYLSGYEVNR